MQLNSSTGPSRPTCRYAKNGCRNKKCKFVHPHTLKIEPRQYHDKGRPREGKRVVNRDWQSSYRAPDTFNDEYNTIRTAAADAHIEHLYSVIDQKDEKHDDMSREIEHLEAQLKKANEMKKLELHNKCKEIEEQSEKIIQNEMEVKINFDLKDNELQAVKLELMQLKKVHDGKYTGNKNTDLEIETQTEVVKEAKESFHNQRRDSLKIKFEKNKKIVDLGCKEIKEKEKRKTIKIKNKFLKKEVAQLKEKIAELNQQSEERLKINERDMNLQNEFLYKEINDNIVKDKELENLNQTINNLTHYNNESVKQIEELNKESECCKQQHQESLKTIQNMMINKNKDNEDKERELKLRNNSYASLEIKMQKRIEEHVDTLKEKDEAFEKERNLNWSTTQELKDNSEYIKFLVQKAIAAKDHNMLSDSKINQLMQEMTQNQKNLDTSYKEIKHRDVKFEEHIKSCKVYKKRKISNQGSLFC